MPNFNVSVRGMLVTNDYISKHAIKNKASNYETSLGEEKESFV